MTVKSAAAALFPGAAGEMAERLRRYDWSKHPLGPPDQWPQSLKVVIQIMLTSRYAMWLGWGEELYFFCNDAYLPTLGIKRDWFLGTPARTVWREIWSDIGPRAESVVSNGMATWDEGLLLFLERSGFAEETYHTFSYSPVPADTGEIGGMLCVVTEETNRVIGERRLATLRDLAAELDSVRTEPELFAAIELLLRRHAKDTPFTALYLFDEVQREARRAAITGNDGSSAFAPEAISLSEPGTAWPAAELLQKPGNIVVSDLSERFADIPKGPWDKPATEAAVMPLLQQGQERPAGFFVAGINPYRPFDPAYKSFIELLSGQIAAALSNVRAYEGERKRAEALAELDRAKTTFFTNISHELRTPLTLILGPIEEELQSGREPKEGLEVAHRNTLRLLKLVNSLLDFSRLEAGRIEAHYEPTDLGKLTADLASVFRSAMQKAGLRFVVDCPSIPEPAFVDREMWEKIVLNLLSNAFKFTFEGEIAVSLRIAGECFELQVKDTGAGIPADQMGQLFERFQRIRGTRSRSIEGTGIGLALIKELTALHGGSVRVVSREGHGSTFTVTVKRGRQHLPVNRVENVQSTRPGGSATAAFVNEALRWLPGRGDAAALDQSPASPPLSANFQTQPRARVLVADDNADMREYVARLLAPTYSVDAVENGAEAWKHIQRDPPDLVLTDVMMPELDGFGLLQKVRSDEQTRQIPVIMLSARAGEEARIDGLDSGVNDYLIKPFSARELEARVSSQLQLATLRREGEERINAILESITDAFLVLDENWRFVRMNQIARRNLARYFGSPGAVIGKSYWDLFPAALGSPIETAFRRAAADKVACECEHFYEPWTSWYSIRAFPLQGGGISVFYQDITERKRRDQRLAEQARLLDLTNDAIIVCEMDDRVLSWNRGAEAMYGWRADEAIGRIKGELLRTIYPEPLPEIYHRLEQGKRWEGELVQHCKEGPSIVVHSRWVLHEDPLLKKRLILKTNNNITAWKAAIDTIRQSEAQLRLVTNNLPALIGYLDRNLKFRFNNERYSEWFGISDLTGRHISEVLGEATFREREAHMRAALEGKQQRFEGVTIHCKRGPRYTEVTYVPDAAAGEVRGFYVFVVDINDLKETQIELKRTQASLEETVAQRTARLRETIGELEAFSYSVSHDMRSPLRAMEGFSQALLEDYGDKLDQDGRNLLLRIEKGARRLDMLIQDVLAYSRVAKGDFDLHIVDLQALIEEIIQNFEFQSASISVSKPLPKVKGHEALLSQIFSNLIGNAIKFAQPNVRPEIRITAQDLDDRVKISVSDNGIGIDPVHFQRIFEIFGRIHPDKLYSGTGIGLAIVKKAVERLGGTLGVESELGKGSTFWFTLIAAGKV